MKKSFLFLIVFLFTLLPLFSESVKIGYYESDFFQAGAEEGAPKKGYAYSYYRKLSEYTGWTYEYVYGSFEELIEKLSNGEIDLLAGLAYSDSRTEYYLYPKEPMGYMRLNLMKRDTAVSITGDPESLNGKKIGVMDNPLKNNFTKYVAENNLDVNIVLYSNYENFFEDFSTGKVDVLYTTGYGTYGVKHAEIFSTFDAIEFFLCVNKKRPDVLKALNYAQTQLKFEDPYYINNLYLEFYPRDVSSRAFTQRELEWLNSHETLKIAYLENFFPYCGVDKNGEVSGIIKDVIPEILHIIGYSDFIKPEYIPCESYKEMFGMLKRGEVDTIFPLGGDIYTGEKNGVLLSTPLITTYRDLIFREDFVSKENLVFAVNKNNTIQKVMTDQYFPDAGVRLYSSAKETLNAVLKGEVDCTTLNGLRTAGLLRNSKYKSLRSQQIIQTESLGFGVMIGNEGLLKILNRSINGIDKNYAINKAYLYTDELYELTFMDFLHNNLFPITGTIVLFMLVIFGFFVISSKKTKNYLLEEEARNNELQKAQENQKAQIREIHELNANINSRMDIIESMSKVYFSAYYIDIEADSFEELLSTKYIRESIGRTGKAQEKLYEMCDKLIQKEFSEQMRSFVNIQNAEERLDNQNVITMEYKGITTGWSQAYLIAGDRDESGKMKHLFFATRIIHAEKEREEQQNKNLADALVAAEHANKAKTTFLNNMSHDIRTPMNAIIGFTSLAESHINNKDMVRDYLRKISTSSNHLLALINDVLDMSRIESGRVKIEAQEVYLPELLKDLRTIIQNSITEKNLDLEIDIRNIVNDYIVTDKLRLNQILINIISNAIKFTPEGGKISVKVREIPCSLENKANFEFKIKDTGIGMSKEFQEHIFEAFTREQSSTVSGIQGTGLGMAITKNIVDVMGGTITVESELGKGSEFTVNLDCQISEVSVRVQKNTAQSEEEPSLENRRILLVEDNMLNQEIAKTILEEAGFAVDIADDGQIAVDTVSEAEEGTYDLIIMDIQMPRKNGYEAAKEIRGMESEVKANIPIIAMTANAFEEDKNEAIKAGMNYHIAKPINVDQLMKTIVQCLK